VDHSNSVELKEREQYRWIIGYISTDLMVTSMHLNETIINKAIAGNATDNDQRRIEDSVGSLRRFEDRYSYMLEQMYHESSLLERDEAFRPIIKELIASTDALLSFLKSKELADRDRYFVHRDAFLDEFKKIEGMANSKMKNDS